MFNITTIKTEFADLVGWRQSLSTDDVQIDAALLTSTSGLYYSDIHPLLTYANIASVAPDYASIVGATETINDFLTQKTDQSIINLLHKWLGQKIVKKTAKNLLSRKKLFELSGNLTNLTASSDKRVGYEIVPKRRTGIKFTITQLGLLFTDAQPSLDIKLFRSGTSAPIYTENVNYDTAGSEKWITITTPWELDSGYSYYLQYDHNVIAGSSINGAEDHTLGGNGTHAFNSNRYFSIHGITTLNSNAALGDLENTVYSHDDNYGINLKFDVRCDYTSFIADTKGLFARAVQLQVGIDMLNLLQSNPESRVNRNEANINWQKMQLALYGESDKKPYGLVHDLDLAIKAIQFDVTGIDSVCLPCGRSGVRYKTI